MSPTNSDFRTHKKSQINHHNTINSNFNNKINININFKDNIIIDNNNTSVDKIQQLINTVNNNAISKDARKYLN